MRPLLRKSFPQPSSSGSSGSITVVLADGKTIIQQDGRPLAMDPALLIDLASDTLTIMRNSKSELTFPDVLALCISEHLKVKESTAQKPARIEKKELRAEPLKSAPELPSSPPPKPSQKRRFALTFTWSEESSHLDLLRSVTLIESKKRSGRDRLKLPKELDEALSQCWSQDGGAQQIAQQLAKLVVQINQEENPLWQLSEKERMSHSVTKMQEYLAEFLRSKGKCNAPLSPSSSSASLFSNSSKSSYDSENKRHVHWSPRN